MLFLQRVASSFLHRRPRPLPGHVQVVARISAAARAARAAKSPGKQTIAEAFPNGLAYRPPQSLLGTDGPERQYLPHQDLHKVVKTHLKSHYDSYSEERFNKADIATYYFVSGTSTDQSRNATEFYRTLVECAEDQPELRARLERAKVFHVGFENGPAPSEPEWGDPLEAVGLRMLHQLLGPELSFDEVVRNYYPPWPYEIFHLVAKHEGGVRHQEFTGVLVVDGLQRFLQSGEYGKKKEFLFNNALNNIAALALDRAAGFIITCCTATITPAMEEFFALSRRHRVFLPVGSLDPQASENGHIVTPVLGDDRQGN